MIVKITSSEPLFKTKMDRDGEISEFYECKTVKFIRHFARRGINSDVSIIMDGSIRRQGENNKSPCTVLAGIDLGVESNTVVSVLSDEGKVITRYPRLIHREDDNDF